MSFPGQAKEELASADFKERAKAALYSVCVVVKHRVFVLLHKKQKSRQLKLDFFIVKCPVKTCWQKQRRPHIKWGEWWRKLHTVIGETAILTPFTFLWWHKAQHGRNTNFPVACFSQRKVDHLWSSRWRCATQKGFCNDIYIGQIFTLWLMASIE